MPTPTKRPRLELKFENQGVPGAASDRIVERDNQLPVGKAGIAVRSYLGQVATTNKLAGAIRQYACAPVMLRGHHEPQRTYMGDRVRYTRPPPIVQSDAVNERFDHSDQESASIDTRNTCNHCQRERFQSGGAFRQIGRRPYGPTCAVRMGFSLPLCFTVSNTTNA